MKILMLQLVRHMFIASDVGCLGTENNHGKTLVVAQGPPEPQSLLPQTSHMYSLYLQYTCVD